MKLQCYILLTLLVCLVDAKRRLKILVHSYSGGYSHLAFQGRLAEAGHEVHVFIPALSDLPYNGTGKAQRIIRFPVPRALAARQNVSYVADPFSGGTNMFSSGILVQVNDVLSTECEEILQDKSMMEWLRKEKYDMALAETWLTYPFGIFKALGIPIHIGTLTISMDGPLASRLGIPQPPSFVPLSLAGTANADRMSYWDRVRNLWLKFLEWRTYAKQAADLNTLFRGKFGSAFPGIEKLVANLSLVFVNVNEFFDIAKPWSHKVITIGGIVDKKPKSLSQDVNAIFEKAENGVVLFSLGTLTNTTKMTAKLKRVFLDAFAKFADVHFIWKLQTTEDDLQTLRNYPNVHVFEWIDQISILAHPKTRAFISHCGINSVNEAAVHGVPVVGIPLFADQLYNAALIQRKKMGVYVDMSTMATTTTMSNGSLLQALNEVLRNPSYHTNAQTVKAKLSAAPFRPAEKFLKWVEFAAEFPDLSELNLAGAELNFCVYHSLDVLAPAAFSFVAIVAVGYYAPSHVRYVHDAQSEAEIDFVRRLQNAHVRYNSIIRLKTESLARQFAEAIRETLTSSSLETATLKLEVVQLEDVSATQLLESMAPFSRLQIRKNFFTPDVVNASLLRFFAINGVFSQCGLSRPSGKSLILWDCGGSISEDAILDYCFGDYVCPRRSRCLAVKNPSVSPRFIAKLIQAHQACERGEEVYLRVEGVPIQDTSGIAGGWHGAYRFSGGVNGSYIKYSGGDLLEGSFNILPYHDIG